MYNCKFCGRLCKNYNSLINHERLCKENPNRQHIESWAHNEKWRKNCHSNRTNQFIKAKKLGLPYPKATNKGKVSKLKGTKRSPEFCKKVSDSMKKVCQGKSIWATQIQKRKSYAEQYFDSIFVNAKRNFHVLTYFLDFTWPDQKIYIEIDGEQHYLDKNVINHDKVRTEQLLKENWICLCRIRWSKFIKLSQDYKNRFIAGCLKKLNDKLHG